MGSEVPCLDESTVVQLLDGTLAAGARAEAEAHLAVCSACTDLTTWAALDLGSPSQAASPERPRFIGQLGPGSRVGRYQILGGIGRGGMGEVYAAYHPDLDRRIAIKVVHEAGADSVERRARLLREARATARLSHPNVVAVHDAGTIGDRVFVVMEYVDGETIDQWLKTAPRSLDQILDVFVAAGRGLAAAHAAGIVHRDFKPQNVMIGGDGAVRVMDFGLAWLDLESEPEAAEASAPGESRTDRPPPDELARVTKTGALLGTPAYMAPEQWRRDAIDARADQFAFCVALHEALHGVRPRPAHLPGPEADGGPAQPFDQRRGLRVPGWMRAVLVRGLQPQREQRYPSLALLLQAIQRGRGRTRRRSWILAVGATVALAAFGTWRFSHARRFDCGPPADRIAQVWDSGASVDGKARSIRAALSASGHPDADSIWRHLSSALDDYLGRWGAMYRQTCEATHLTGKQSLETLDLGMRCLDEALDDVRALTTVLATADRRALGGATAAVGSLAPVDRCANVALLRSAVQLPRDPQVLQAVLVLQPQVKEAFALREIQRYRESYDAAIALRPRAEAIGYRPLIAQVLETAGVAQLESGGPALGEELLEQAVFVAEAGGDDITAARAASHLIMAAAYRGAFDEADRWFRWVNAILDRLGGDHARLRSWAIQNEASAAYYRGDYERARVLTERAAELKISVLGPDHQDVGISLNNLSDMLNRLGRPEEALAACDKAMAIFAKRGSRDFIGWINRGHILTALARYGEAEEAFNRAIHLMDGEIQSAGDFYADAWFGQGRLRVVAGRPAAAIGPLERALNLRKQAEPKGVPTADVEILLAQASLQSGGDRRRALRLAAEARDIFAARGLADRARETQALLESAQRPRRRVIARR